MSSPIALVRSLTALVALTATVAVLALVGAHGAHAATPGAVGAETVGTATGIDRLGYAGSCWTTRICRVRPTGTRICRVVRRCYY